jgi:hypothetical protein
MARLIKTEKEVEGRYTETWTRHEGGKPPSWAPPGDDRWHA